jgi:hypothetical protein
MRIALSATDCGLWRTNRSSIMPPPFTAIPSLGRPRPVRQQKEFFVPSRTSSFAKYEESNCRASQPMGGPPLVCRMCVVSYPAPARQGSSCLGNYRHSFEHLIFVSLCFIGTPV